MVSKLEIKSTWLSIKQKFLSTGPVSSKIWQDISQEIWSLFVYLQRK